MKPAPDRGTGRSAFLVPEQDATNRGALAALLDDAARPVVMCGLSSGGYASMLYGELLTRAFPQRPITTVSINPQTVHGATHRAFSLGEMYQSAFIAPRPGFDLRPFRLGVRHIQGIEHIFAAGEAHDAMRSAVRA